MRGKPETARGPRGPAPVIGLSGSYGGLNLGDEAILTAIVSELRRVLPDAEIVVFSRDAEHTRAHHDVDRAVAAREATREEIVAEVERLDLLLLGGGGILYDREARSYLYVVRLAQERGIPTATFAIGAGPLERHTEREAVGDALNRMHLVTVREASAKRLLDEIGVRREIHVTADPALLLEPEPFDEEMLKLEGADGERPLVGMSVREPGGAVEIDEADYHAMLANAADFIVDRFDVNMLFVPMERSDVREAHKVIGAMVLPERAGVLRREYSAQQILGLMSHFEFAVGMRLHFLIFAALARVPLLALPYASKVASLLEALEIPTPRLEHREHAGVLLAAIDRLVDSRDMQRARLEARVPELRRRAAGTAPLCARLLDREHRVPAVG